MPKPADGLAVNAFATGLDHPRWLYVLPNGDVLVAETNTPKQEEASAASKAGSWRWTMEHRRRRRAEPEPHRAAARRRRRRRGRDEKRVPRRTQLAVRHGADRRQVLCRRYRCAAPLRLHRRARPRSSSRAPRSPICRRVRINHHWTKSLVARPTGRGFMSASARTAMPARTASTGRRTARDPRDRCGDRRGAQLRHRLAQSGRAGLRAGDRRAVGCGQRARRARQRSRSGLSHLGEGRRVLRLAVQLLGPACRRAGEAAKSGRGGQARSPRTIRSAIMWRRSGSPSRKASCCRSNSGAARSSASMARGTACPFSGYKVVFVPFARASRRAQPLDVLTGFLSDEARRAAGRPASPSTGPARCWSPTMSAISCGG